MLQIMRRCELKTGDVFRYRSSPEYMFWYVNERHPDGPDAYVQSTDASSGALGSTWVELIWCAPAPAQEPETKEEYDARTGTTRHSAPESKLADGGTGASMAVSPAHYTALSPEPVDVIEAWSLNFRLANALKYIARHGRKPTADPCADLKKAVRYLQREIAATEGRRGAWE